MLFLILLMAFRCVFGKESLLRVKHSATGRGGCCQDTCSQQCERLVRRPRSVKREVESTTQIAWWGWASLFGHDGNIDTLSANRLES